MHPPTWLERPLLIACAIGGLVGLAAAVVGLAKCTFELVTTNQSYPPISTRDALREIETAQLSAGHYLATCRHIPDGTEGNADSLWLERETPGNDAQVVVLFVHGYNTPPAAAIQRGEGLNQLLRGQTGVPLAVVTFLWRGDYGESKFAKSQDSAMVSGRCFVNFMQSIRARCPASKLLIISHSLGARVVLAGLAGLQLEKERDIAQMALFIQPAVRLDEVSRWRQQWFVPKTREGKFFNALRAVESAFWTASAEDEVLKKWFNLGDQSEFGIWHRPFPQALGSISQPEHVKETEIHGRRSAWPVRIRNRHSLLQEHRVFDVAPANHSSLFDEHADLLADILASLVRELL